MDAVFQAILDSQEAPKVLKAQYTALLRYIKTANGEDLSGVLTTLKRFVDAAKEDLTKPIRDRVFVPAHSELLRTMFLPDVVTALLGHLYIIPSDYSTLSKFLACVLDCAVAELNLPNATAIPEHIMKVLTVMFNGECLVYRDDPHCPTKSEGQYITPVDTMSQLYGAVVDAFGSLGGFDALNRYLQCVQRGLVSPTDPEAVFSHVLTLSRSLCVLGACTPSLAKDHRTAIAANTENAMRSFVVAMSLDISRRVTSDDVRIVFDQFSTVIQSCLGRTESDPIVSSLTLALVESLLASALLDKRLFAISELSAIANAAANNRRGVRSLGRVLPDPHSAKLTWVTDALLWDWLSTKGIIEYLFGPGLHPELLKRCADLLLYLSDASACALTVEQLRLVWAVATGQHHGAIASAATFCLREIAPYLPLPLMTVLVNTCLPELSAASVTDELAELLSTIGDCMAKAYEDSLIPNIAFTLWNLSQDNRSTALPSADTASPTVGSSVAHHNVLPTLLSSLSKLLKSDAALTLLEPFFTRIVANVKTSSSVPQALFLLTHLAPLPQGYIRTPVGEVLSEDIIDLIHLPAMTLSWVQKKFDFTNLLIAELGMYHTRAQTRLDAMKGSGEAPSDAGVLILADRYPHLRQVSHRLSTLTSTLRASAAQLTSDQLSSLWEQTVTNALCPSEATLMCRFIENALPTVAFQTSTEWPLSVTLSREAALVVMQPLVPTAAANPSTSIPALFSTFAHVFKVVNLINGDLKVAADDSAVMFSPAKGNVLGASPPHGQLERSAPQPTAVTVTRPSLLGLPQLWTVALTAVCDEVTVAASLWLVHCHVFVEGSSSIRSTLRQSFIDTCMAEMGSSTPHSPNRVQRVLNLLSLFVTQSESVVALDQNQSRLSPAVKRLGDTFARSGPPTPSRSPLPTSKRPPALTRQGSRDTDDFIEDDRHSPSDRISSSVGDTAADDPSMLDGAPAVIRGHIVIRCTILDPELPPSATLVEISHDASVGELRQLISSRLELGDSPFLLRHNGSDVTSGDDSSLLTSMAITHGARLYVHVGDIGAEPTPTDGPPVDLNSTGTGTPSRSAPGSPKSSSVDGLPPVTPGKLSLPPRQDSISSTGHRLSSLPDSPLPKSVAQLISAASRHSSPARVRSPASTLNSDAASEGGASSTMTPIRHVPGSNFFSDDADVQTGSVKSAVSQPGRTLSDGISGTTSERRRVSVGKPPLTPSQIIVTTVDTTPAKPSRPVIIGPPAEVAQYPSMMLANNPKHFGLLLSLLELPSPLCDNAWKLVSILPPNAALTDTVLSLSTCDVKGFTSVCASLFGARTTYKSLYSLILLENIAKVPAPAAGSAALTSPLLNTGFVNGFLSRGGIAVLTQLFQACSTVCSPASPSMCDIQSLLLLVRLHTLLLPVASDASLTGSILPIALASLQVWATAPITPDVEELLVQLLKLLKLSWSTASSAELTLSSVLPSLLLHECRHVRATTAAFCYWLCSSADGCVGYDAGSVPLNEPKLSSPPNRTVSFLNGSLTTVLTVIAADANKQSCRANTFELMRLLCRLCWRVCASGVSEPVLPVLKWISTVFSRMAPFEHDFQQSGTLESPVDKVYEGQVGVPAGLATALLTCYTDDDPYDTFLTVMGVSISESLPFLAVKDDDESRSGGSGEKAPTAPANNALNDEDVMAGEPQPGRDELLTGSLVLFRVILRGDTQWGTAPAVLTEAISTGLVTQIASIVLNSTGNNLALMLCSRLAAFGALFDIASGVLLPRIASGVVKGSSENLAVIQAFRYLSTSPPARECFVLVMQALQEHMEAVMSEANGWDFDMQPGQALIDRQAGTEAHIGLVNPGCVCYSNALMQQLFRTTVFRAGILSARGASTDTDNGSLLRELQTLFAHLQHGCKRAYDPTPLFRTFKDMDGNPTDVRTQQDAQEFLTLLLDRVESSLKGTGQEQLVSSTFTGSIVNRVEGQCGHISKREEPFCMLSLAVAGCNNLDAALTGHTKGEDLSGDNAYACDECKTKVNAVKRVCLGKLPPTLVVHLKRLEFDFESMLRQKINSRCEFPTELDLFPFTDVGMKSSPEDPTAVDDSLDTGTPTPLPTPSPPQPSPLPADVSTKYTLVGVVVHRGSASAGHYFSYIKSQSSDDWHEFNDHAVLPYDPTNLPTDAFGGDVIMKRWDELRRSKVPTLMENPQNAYMLVYQRVGHVESPPVPADDELLTAIGEENRRLYNDRVLFDGVYAQFLLDLLAFAAVKMNVCLRLPESGDGTAVSPPFSEPAFLALSAVGDAWNPELALFQTAIRYLFHAAAFSQESSLLMKWLDTVSAFMDHNQQAARWLLHWCANRPDALRLCLLECPQVMLRRVLSTLLRMAVLVVYPSERGTPDGGTVKAFITCLFTEVLAYVPTHWRRLDQFCSLLSSFADLGPRAILWMCEMDGVVRLVDALLCEKSPYTPKHIRRSAIEADVKSLPQFGPLVRLLSVLVCSSYTTTFASYRDEKVTSTQELAQRRELLAATSQSDDPEDEAFAEELMEEIQQLQATINFCSAVPETFLPLGDATHDLSKREMAALHRPDVFTAMLKTNYTPVREFGQQYQHGPSDLLRHLSWHDKAVSELIMTCIVFDIEGAVFPSDLKPMLACLNALLNLTDPYQLMRVKKALNPRSGLPFHALSTQRYRPQISATLIVFIQALRGPPDAPRSLITDYIDSIRTDIAWMTQWLVDFDAAQSTVPPPPRSRPSLSHLFIGGTALDVDAPFDANADFDTGDLDNLSGFGSLDDVDDDRGSMGDLDE